MLRTQPRWPRAAGAVALSATLALGLASCSGDDPDADDDAGGSDTSSGAPALRTTASAGTVVGALKGTRREQLVARVGNVVDGWIEGAYLGDYPRTDFSDAFAGFTPGAAADARRDGGLMSNKAIGKDVDQVVATRRKLVVDTLAVEGRAVSATARFVLAMEVEGEIRRKERVSGRLFMTYADGAWRVFGYDVARGRGR